MPYAIHETVKLALMRIIVSFRIFDVTESSSI